MEKVLVDKALLDLDEFCLYLGIGKTKARELLTKTENDYAVRIGNRLYANKILLDRWLNTISGNKIIGEKRVKSSSRRTCVKDGSVHKAQTEIRYATMAKKTEKLELDRNEAENFSGAEDEAVTMAGLSMI